MKSRFCWLAIVLMFTHVAKIQSQTAPNIKDSLTLHRTSSPHGDVSTGQMTVFENRQAGSGRQLQLDVVVLHANGADPNPDPMFVLLGGPGLAAAGHYQSYQQSWMREDRDLVFVSQRGTGGSNRLDFPTPHKKAGPQQYLDPFFDPGAAPYAIEQLSRRADLRMYSTPLAMDDLNDVRRALGYDKINLIGGSYGTRAALIYLRRHGETVRTAILNGVAPIEFTNPLYHARSAQAALEKIFQRVEADEIYQEAFPDLRQKFEQVLQRFDEGPIDVTYTADDGQRISVQLSREAFATALRFQMYYMNTSRMVPAQIHHAHRGNFQPFVESAIERNRALSNAVAMGMLLCVTAAEDVARIDSKSIEALTRDTFLGDTRVRRQMAVCRHWPKSELPPNFGEPVRSDVPTLILSGTIDPVTPPEWGDIVAKNFPNSLHIVAPAAHGVGGACIDHIQRAFLNRGTVAGLDTSCVDKLKLPPLYLPKEEF